LFQPPRVHPCLYIDDIVNLLSFDAHYSHYHCDSAMYVPAQCHVRISLVSSWFECLLFLEAVFSNFSHKF